MPTQGNWRNCWNCQALFFSGHAATQGFCPKTGGGHEGHADDPNTFNFALNHSVAPTADSQADWRNCWSCQELFFAGHPTTRGFCPKTGGGHEGHESDPQTFNFVLTHDVVPAATSQNAWRNCWNCQTLFYNGHKDNKGFCPKTQGGHEGHPKESFNFVLSFTVGT
jgi:hypothetical protein